MTCTHRNRKTGSLRAQKRRGLFPRYTLRKAVHSISYRNAEEILPEELLTQIRKYIEGEAIYIPKATDKRKSWGGKTGTRAEYDRRNRAIAEEYRDGQSVTELAEKYCLCPDSIRKILRNTGE